MVTVLKKLGTAALNILLPPRCISCSEAADEVGGLCAACWTGLDFIMEPRCRHCGYPLEPDAEKGSICGHCIQQEPPYESGVSVFCYNDQSKKLITQFKYSDKLHAVSRLAEWMSQTPGKEFFSEADAIVPVPLHWRRLLSRKYNQAALLAQAIGKRAHIPYVPEMLVRRKHIPPQASLNRKQRLKNVKGAFAVHPKRSKSVKGKTIILVDDVMTTGATLDECAKILMRAGARSVRILTLARTVEGR